MSSILGSLRRRYRQLARNLRRLGQVPARLETLEQRIARLTRLVETHNRETQLALGQLSTPPDHAWRGLPPLIPGEPAPAAFPNATTCIQAHFEQPWFSYWTATLGEGLRYHRKLWEFVFICQALWERGAIRPGARGLGFGVGIEPLPAYFASRECEVTATDIGVETAAALGWTGTNEHAGGGLERLRRPHLWPTETFDRNVTFREVDMNAVPADLTDFDFCWSACALEHLGSIQHGLDFIERSIACLKPGGWAVHTTEFNLTSDVETVDHENTVLFRRGDLQGLIDRLNAQGHRAAPLEILEGDGPVDRFYDLAPYRPQPHLKMALAGYGTTSVGLIVQRGG